MIPPSARLRRALHLRSETLVRRIILSNPDLPNLVRSADLDNNATTSLHLCARLGLPQIAEFLLDQGHEEEGISRTLDGLTAMMVAAAAGGNEDDEVAVRRVQVGLLLIERFPDAVAIRDKLGMDVFSHAAKHGTDALLITLLSNPPPASLLPDPTSTYTTHPLLAVQDSALNTPLHHASAFGHLKTLRLLISAGADHAARNAYQWTPVDYSATVAAEVYLKGLVREREQLLMQRLQRRESPSSGGLSRSPIARLRGGSDEKARGPAPRGAGAVRLVRSDTSGTEEEEQVATVFRNRARAQT